MKTIVFNSKLASTIRDRETRPSESLEFRDLDPCPAAATSRNCDRTGKSSDQKFLVHVSGAGEYSISIHQHGRLRVVTIRKVVIDTNRAS
jgi:hypothetical protein